MQRKKNDFSLIGFIIKSLIFSIWVVIFAYPGMWHLSISDEAYYRYQIWRKSSMLVDPPVLPFVDLYHRYKFPVHNAALRGRLDRIENLSTGDERLNVVDSFYMTPLAYAVISRKADNVNFFIKAGAQVDVPLLQGQTALAMALSRGLENIAIILLENNARSDIKDANGICPIHLAIQKNQVNAIRKLISLEHDVNVKDGNGLNPLDYAIKQGSMVMVAEIAVGGARLEFSAAPDNLEISAFLARWQQVKDVMKALQPEDTGQKEYPLPPAELPMNVSPTTYKEIRGRQ